MECTEAHRKRVARRRAERAAAPKDPNDPRHGTPAFYSNHGCRCEKCIAAHVEKCQKGQERRTAAVKDPLDPRHGKFSFYVGHGCRCDKCRAIASKTMKERRNTT